MKASFEAIVRELESEVASHAGRCGAADAAGTRALAAVAMCLGGLGLARSVRGRSDLRSGSSVVQEAWPRRCFAPGTRRWHRSLGREARGKES